MAETCGEIVSRLSMANYENKKLTYGEYVNREKALRVLYRRQDIDGLRALEANNFKNCDEIIIDEMMKQMAAAGATYDESIVRKYFASTSDARDQHVKSDYTTVELSAAKLYDVIGEQLSHCRIEQEARGDTGEDDEYEYDYKLYNSEGAMVCENYEDDINVMCLDESGVILVNEGHDTVEVFRLSLEEAYAAGIELGDYERLLPSYNPIAEQLMKHLANRSNTESLSVENDKFVGMYSFIKYGEARLVYRAYEPKTTNGQEFNPFVQQPLLANNGREMQLAGVVWADTFYKLTDMYDPFIPQVAEKGKIVSFDDYCRKFSEYATERLQTRLGDDSIKITVTRDEYLDYLANKVDDETLMKRFEAKLVLEDMDVSEWWRDENKLARLTENCIISGTPIATANLHLPAHNFTYPVYIVERDDKNGKKVYDACIADNDKVVPLADDAAGFKSEMDARYRGEIYFKDIATSPCKPELGREQPKSKANKDVER